MAWWDNLYLNEGFATLVGDIRQFNATFVGLSCRYPFEMGEVLMIGMFMFYAL